MTEQLKAEAYVRSQRPALMELTFGCEVTYKGSVGVPKINMTATVLQTTQSGSIEIYTSHTRYVNKDELTVIGHRPQLQDWLAVLGSYNRAARIKNHQWGIEVTDDAVIIGNYKIILNLNTGQPATEADYLAFNDITGI